MEVPDPWNCRESHMSLSEPTFEYDPTADTWVEPMMEWVAGIEEWESYSQEEQARRLRDPAEWSWVFPLAEQLIAYLRKTPQAATPESDALHGRLQTILPRIASWYLKLLFDSAESQDASIDLLVAEQSARLYQSIYVRKCIAAEGALLQCLSWNRNEHAIKLLVEVLLKLPPHDWSGTALAISPLMRSTAWKIDWVFPKLLEGLHHSTTVAPFLDLGNYVVRSKMATEHPMKSMQASLLQLLGGVVARMGVMEEDPRKFGESVEAIQHVLNESVALCVSACDAVGLMGDQAAIPKLNQAMQLRHRRVQVEAAAALARLGDEAGKKALLDFAKDHATRLRVLQYCRELGLEDQVEESWKSPVAVAESELSIWLSQPTQMSLPPTDIELICQQTLYWPGFEDPQECYLFRYSYRFPDCEFSNIGMAGPIVHSFAADLGDLSEEDIFAAFAGWCAEHHDIYEVESFHFNSAQDAEARKMETYLRQEGYDEIRPLFLGFFVGERALVASAHKGEVAGTVVTDGLEIVWFPEKRSTRPLRPEDVYSIYKGRKILRTFN